MLPLTVGFLIAGPTSGYLSDRYGARLFSTGGLVVLALAFVGLMLLPVNFSYPEFAGLLLLGRPRARHVLLPQHLGHHGQCAAGATRGGVGHARDLPELRHRAVHRCLLLADDRRSVQSACRTR